jgi:thiol:disulfide interchange protein DsbD
MWVFSAQTNTFSLICLLAGFLFFAIGAWIYGRGCSPIIPKKKQVLAYAFTALFVFAGVKAIMIPKATWDGEGASSFSSGSGDPWVGWENFSPERLAQLRSEGKPVLIDFTAKWCLICQANHLTLSSGSVSSQLDKAGVIKMRADWTKNDPVITEELSKYGRNSVPLYLLFGQDGNEDPLVLPQVLTADNVLDHLNRAVPEDEIAMK